MSDSRYAASALYYLTLVRVHPLYVSKHFLLGPREHGELPFPFVLYSAIHRPFLSACSANRPLRSVPRFWGVFQRERGTFATLHGDGATAAVFEVTPAKQIPPAFPTCFHRRLLCFLFTTLVRIPTFSPIIMFYFACLMDSLKRSLASLSLHRRPWCVGITILFA